MGQSHDLLGNTYLSNNVNSCHRCNGDCEVTLMDFYSCSSHGFCYQLVCVCVWREGGGRDVWACESACVCMKSNFMNLIGCTLNFPYTQTPPTNIYIAPRPPNTCPTPSPPPTPTPHSHPHTHKPHLIHTYLKSVNCFSNHSHAFGV